jgi:hypothetical protein
MFGIMKSEIKIFSLIAITLVSSLLIFAVKNKEPKPKSDTNTSEFYKIKALKIPKNIFFAGERVPLEKPDIKERVDRELLVNTYWQSNGLLFFKRSHKYFPIIEPILKKNGIPDDFKYLAVIESGLMNVASPAGARGFWQLLKDTAKENGLEVNDNVDERYNLELATQAACNYLKESKKTFGTWTLAAAAYNAGITGISKKLETQQVKSYYDLLVGDETKRYVPRIVAVKEILTHPKKYGFIFEKADLYNLEPTKTIKVDTVITNIAQFSKHFGINYKTLKLYNPWLRENKLNNITNKEYNIKIPIKKS